MQVSKGIHSYPTRRSGTIRSLPVRCMHLACEFEVYGRVQGVFFRAHTVQQAKSLKLVGWVANTPHGTVKGEMQGPAPQIREMKAWLRHTGSPASVIEDCRFNNERELPALEYDDFAVKRSSR